MYKITQHDDLKRLLTFKISSEHIVSKCYHIFDNFTFAMKTLY